MNPESIVALVGIVVSGILSGFSVYLVYKDRSASYNHVVYTKQVEATIELFNAFGDFFIELLISLDDEESPLSDEARSRVEKRTESRYNTLLRVLFQQLILIPLEVNNKLKAIENLYLQTIFATDQDGEKVTDTDIEEVRTTFRELFGEAVFLARTDLGIDVASDKVLRLLGKSAKPSTVRVRSKNSSTAK